MLTKRRHRSCPPCVRHDGENIMTSPCGVTCMIRCPTRDSYYKDLHINEDRGHLWALIERARDLLPICSPATLQTPELLLTAGIEAGSEVQNISVWTCACGILSDQSVLFCWNCGAAKAAEHSLHFGLPTPNVAFDHSPRQVQAIYEPSTNTQPAVDPSKDDLGVPVGNAISQSSLDALGCAISKFAPSSGSGMGADESTVSNIDSFPNFGSGTSGSDDKDVSASEGGRSNSGEESVDRPVQEITTLMICSIPFQVTSEELLQAMDSFGFVGTYDFLYMPSRTAAKKHGKTRRGNVGYAFVNFKNSRLASRFSSAFTGYIFPGSEKQVFVRPAVSQGLAANLGNDDRTRKNQHDIMLFPPRDIFQ